MNENNISTLVEDENGWHFVKNVDTTLIVAITF